MDACGEKNISLSKTKMNLILEELTEHDLKNIFSEKVYQSQSMWAEFIPRAKPSTNTDTIQVGARFKTSRTIKSDDATR